MTKSLKIFLITLVIFVSFTVLPYIFIKYVITPAVLNKVVATKMNAKDITEFYNSNEIKIINLIDEYKSKDFNHKTISTDSIYWKPKNLEMQEILENIPIRSIQQNEDSTIFITVDEYWFIQIEKQNKFIELNSDTLVGNDVIIINDSVGITHIIKPDGIPILFEELIFQQPKDRNEKNEK